MVNINKFKCAILGGTGIVGQRFVKLLEHHPFFELSLITASEKNNNRYYDEAVHWLLKDYIPDYVKSLKIRSFNLDIFKEKNIKVVFSALPPDIAKKQERILAENGFAVFSNSRAYRYKEDVPILIPEVNPEHIELIKNQQQTSSGFIITNANCSTTGLSIVLKPLLKYSIRNVFVSTYQALSGAGYPGVSSLDINGNVIPFIEGEDEKIEFETKKILGDIKDDKIQNKNFQIIANCARVPVRDGHLESVVVDFEKEIPLSNIIESFNKFQQIKNLPSSPIKPIILRKELDRPQPFKDVNAGEPAQAKGMAVSIGRLKKYGKKISFWLVVHNTIRGASGNSILNAELALKKGYIRGD